MNESNVPDGMISAESFAKLNGLSPENLIQKIRDGLHAGCLIDGKWYVSSDQLDSSEKRKKIAAVHENGVVFEFITEIFQFISTEVVLVLRWLSVLSFVAGIVLSIAFLPSYSDLIYARERNTAPYAWSVIWMTAGIVEAAIFVAIARIISLLEKIAKNTEK